MEKIRPFSHALDRLRAVGLRPTRQRLALAKLLFENGQCHVTAEQLHNEAMANNIRVSLATVYNTLHQFTGVGLLREIVVDAGRSYFDTLLHPHHHFFNETTGTLTDVPDGQLEVVGAPVPPSGTEVESVSLVIRLREAG